ncbi:MAG: cobalamin biosynthesis protein CobD [Synergistaceae bacterium]|nr:adenosylcobinamide-phosphate synthase CbiB [Synergistota bacterium]NLM71840.1 cobalamin biosynthesis protein CobD [Synergistaceae bacterium]
MSLFVVLFAAAAWDLLLDEPPSAAHPVVWMGKYVGAFWNRRPAEVTDRKRLIFGGIIVLTGALVFSLPPLLLRFLPGLVAMLLAIPLLKCVFSIGALLRAGEGVMRAVDLNDLPEARKQLSWSLVSRDTEGLSASEVVGAAIESLSENLTDSLASPLFFYSLFGLPGAYFYRYINTCDSMIGYRGGDFEWGGKIAARVDDVLNWIPSRIASVLLLLAGAAAGEDIVRGVAALRDERGKTASPNAGWTMSVMAGLLRVTLEKRDCYSIEGGDEPLDTAVLARCLRVVRICSAMILAFAAALGGLGALFT